MFLQKQQEKAANGIYEIVERVIDEGRRGNIPEAFKEKVSIFFSGGPICALQLYS